VSKLAFEFERRKLAIDEVRELIYREVLEYHPQVSESRVLGGLVRFGLVWLYVHVCVCVGGRCHVLFPEESGVASHTALAPHATPLNPQQQLNPVQPPHAPTPPPHAPQVLQDYLTGSRLPAFMYPSALDNFKRQFMFLEGQGSAGGASHGSSGSGKDGGGMGGVMGGAGAGGGGGAAGRHGVGTGGRPIMGATSLPRERVGEFQSEAAKYGGGRGGADGGGIYSSSTGGAMQTHHMPSSAYHQQHHQSQQHMLYGATNAAALATTQPGAAQQQAVAAAAIYQQQLAAAAAAQQQQQMLQQQHHHHQQQQLLQTHYQSHVSVEALGSSVGSMSVDDQQRGQLPYAPGGSQYNAAAAASYQPTAHR